MTYYYSSHVVPIPCVKKIPPTSKSRLKGTKRKTALMLGFLYPTKQIPLKELASTCNLNITNFVLYYILCILQLLDYNNYY